MESKEISELAKTHVDAIFVHKLTKAEVVMLLAVITARVNQALSSDFNTNQVLKNSTGAEPAVVTKPLGSIIANKGNPCVCVMCAKHIYTVNKNIHENTSVAEFIDSFTPMPGYKLMTKQMKISNVDNNITTNCPSCGGEFTLYLAGRQIG
jgi:hypothetical protein